MTPAPVPANSPLEVLVVEDDYLLAEVLVEALARLGCHVSAQASSLQQALDMAAVEPCDLAVVDMNLHGFSAVPVLDVLRHRGIHFLIATGLERDSVPAVHANAPLISKPYDMAELADALRRFREYDSSLQV